MTAVKKLSALDIVQEKEKIRDKYQEIVLKDGADAEEVLRAYREEIISFVQKNASDTSAKSFELPAINLSHTQATTIDPQYVGLDLVSVNMMATDTLQSDNVDFNIENDTAILKRLTQNFINKNNQKAEVALSSEKNDFNGTMISYASKEQELVDLYKYLMLQYQKLVQKPLDPSLYKLSLYFDNYFVDFEENLKHIEKSTSGTEHPYYMKMFRTTQDKLSVIYRVYLDNIKTLNVNYIADKKAYTQLEHEKLKYRLEYEMLLSEFQKYATLFLHALDADSKEFEIFNNDYNELAERFK